MQTSQYNLRLDQIIRKQEREREREREGESRQNLIEVKRIFYLYYFCGKKELNISIAVISTSHDNNKQNWHKQ